MHWMLMLLRHFTQSTFLHDAEYSNKKSNNKLDIICSLSYPLYP